MIHALLRTLTLALLTAIALALPAAAERRVALVIGASNYLNVPDLPNAANDSQDVANTLRRLGFDVTYERDLSGEALRRSLQSFQRRATGAEAAVLFYAGHGIAVDGMTRIVPVDARLASQSDVDFETLPLDLLLRSIDGASQIRLAILDACRNNPFIANMAPVPGRARSISRGLAPVEPGRGDTLVWYAARDGATASDGHGRNSPFTAALLEHIDEPGLEIGRLFRVVRDSVLRKTGEQEPFVYGSRGTNDFFFRPGASQAAPNPCSLVTVPQGFQCRVGPDGRAAVEPVSAGSVARVRPVEPAPAPTLPQSRVRLPDPPAAVETAPLAASETGQERPAATSSGSFLSPPLFRSKPVAPAPAAPAPVELPTAPAIIAPTAPSGGTNCFQFNGETVCD